MKRSIFLFTSVLCLLLLFVFPAAAEDSPLTPSGNLKLVDDIQTEEKQIITVQSRGGSYYYIIIDRSGEDYNVHFLNAVDERDLFAIVKDDELLPECTCIEKCEDGHVDSECKVCSVNYESCKAETVSEKQGTQRGFTGMIPMLITFALIGVIGFAGYSYYKEKRKPDIPKPVVPDDDDEDEEDTEAVPEPVGEENADTGKTEQQEEKTESENENEEDSMPADEENEETEEELKP